MRALVAGVESSGLVFGVSGFGTSGFDLTSQRPAGETFQVTVG